MEWEEDSPFPYSQTPSIIPLGELTGLVSTTFFSI